MNYYIAIIWQQQHIQCIIVFIYRIASTVISNLLWHCRNSGMKSTLGKDPGQHDCSDFWRYTCNLDNSASWIAPKMTTIFFIFLPKQWKQLLHELQLCFNHIKPSLKKVLMHVSISIKSIPTCKHWHGTPTKQYNSTQQTFAIRVGTLQLGVSMIQYILYWSQ